MLLDHVSGWDSFKPVVWLLLILEGKKTNSLLKCVQDELQQKQFILILAVACQSASQPLY